MKMFPSVIVTALIVSAVWSAVWAQQVIPSNNDIASQAPAGKGTKMSIGKVVAKTTKENRAILPLSLVGISSLSDYQNAADTAQKLFSELIQNPDLTDQLKDIKQLHLYLVYRSSNDQKLQISAAIEASDLKQSHFEAVALPKGDYQPLAHKGSSIKQLANAWQKLDKQRMFNVILEKYRLDLKGNFVDGHSQVIYK
jgi:predicted transcriptional regulator YdeE